MEIQTLNVSFNNQIKDLSYPIFIGNNLLANSGELLEKHIINRKVIIIYDDYFSKKGNLNESFRHFYQSIKKISHYVSLIGIPGGDHTKNMNQLIKLVNEILSLEIDRDSLIIAFGGGVIGDIAGLVASILLRGINFIQVPTTLLSQVDSSVGGKTGVNSKFGKNLIGSFHQPLAVLADTNILTSLPKREFRAGFAEVIKYGLIKDFKFFKWLEKERENIFAYDKLKLQTIITHSCKIKAEIVEQDEKEKGNRALLNLGHTFAHAIEYLGKYDGKVIHGEAVSVGICMAFRLSNKLGFCSSDETQRVINLFQNSNLPTTLSDLANLTITTHQMIERFRYDKKNKQNKLTFILNHKIGKSFINNDMNINILSQFLDEEN